MKILLIAALALATSGIFALFFGIPALGPDAIQYDRLGYNLASGHGFSLSDNPPFSPTMLREPVYPFFLALIYMIFGHNINPVFVIQMIMHAAAALLVYCIAREVFPGKTALFSGLLTAVFPALAAAPLYLLSETLFTFILCLGIYVFSMGLKTGKMALFLSGGAIFGLLVLTKVVAIFLPLLLIAAAIVMGVMKSLGVKRASAGLLLFFLVFSTALSAWSLRNNTLFNTFSLTVRGGAALWSRARKVDYPPRQILINACYAFSESLGGRFFPDPSIKPERYLYRDLDMAESLWALYREKGLKEPEIDAILKKEAMGKIAMHPVKYISYTAVEAIKMAGFTYLPLLNEARLGRYFDTMKNGRLMLAAVKGVFKLSALPVLFLFLSGIFKNLRLWDRWLPVVTVVIYFNGICSLMDATARYAIPIIPFYCIMACAAFYKRASYGKA